MAWTEPARLLLRKARQDQVIVSRAVDDAEIADEIVGFHVQQACEKCMKAVLCMHEVAYRRTHDLQELYDLLNDSGVSLPEALRELVEWSPFAVTYRYEECQPWTPSIGCVPIIWSKQPSHGRRRKCHRRRPDLVGSRSKTRGSRTTGCCSSWPLASGTVSCASATRTSASTGRCRG